MKINLKDIKLDWTIYPNIPSFVEKDFDLLSNVFFNVIIKSEFNEVLTEKKDIPSKKIDKMESFNLHFSHFSQVSQTLFVGEPSIPIEMIASNPRKGIETNFFDQNVKKVIKENFDFLFEENVNLYHNLYKKHGFFKKLIFNIKYNNSDYVEDIDVEYNSINKSSISLQKIFPKIFKSQDNISLKFKIDFNSFKQTEISSLYITPYIYKQGEKIKLKDIYVPNIKDKWLNNSDNSKLLTIPFEENLSIVENILLLDIYVLNQVQTDILDFFKEKLSKTEFDDLAKEYFNEQKLETNFIYGEDLINKIAGFYQGYLYLFNPESINRSYPEEEQALLNIKYKNYFPKFNYNETETRSIEQEIDVESSVLQINQNILESNMFGYKLPNNKFIDINDDLSYFKSENIQSASILQINKVLNKNNIYLEFITNFDIADDIYVDNIANNLNFIRKYYKNINNINYVCLLFMYEYDNVQLDSYQDITNIINGKKFINFNIKIY